MNLYITQKEKINIYIYIYTFSIFACNLVIQFLY